MKHVGQTIATILEEKKLTQKYVAEKIGHTAVSMNKILKKDSIDCALLERICNVLNVSPSLFFEDNTHSQSIVGSNNIQAINSTIALEAKEREVELLKEVLAEKERTIKILLERK